ncbi:hypothetical protein E2C01_003476 [Portunus trituberculatus]|uniref:Uncharacterized protein n=1 Tax=Portunus trituberculatus TaxID=210409 RepID=A0A5B7CMA7_PORTR|nr:hypothetical protein [Portunus trituberculatus]
MSEEATTAALAGDDTRLSVQRPRSVFCSFIFFISASGKRENDAAGDEISSTAPPPHLSVALKLPTYAHHNTHPAPTNCLLPTSNQPRTPPSFTVSQDNTSQHKIALKC